jgi:hypothetical protein
MLPQRREVVRQEGLDDLGRARGGGAAGRRTGAGWCRSLPGSSGRRRQLLTSPPCGPKAPAPLPPIKKHTVGASFLTPASRRLMSNDGSRASMVVIADAASVLPNTRSLMSWGGGGGMGGRGGQEVRVSGQGWGAGGGRPSPCFCNRLPCPCPPFRRAAGGRQVAPVNRGQSPRAPPLCAPSGCRSSRSGPGCPPPAPGPCARRGCPPTSGTAAA